MQSSSTSNSSRINVSVRIKPLSETEKIQERNKYWQVINNSGAVMHKHTKETFAFGKKSFHHNSADLSTSIAHN